MTYNEALEYIHGARKFGSKLGLHNMEILLELMGNPHKQLRFVHVAGTNGKGSTSAFIASILMEAGYRTGLYTSPYIQRFTERMQIGAQEIDGDELADITAFVKSCVDRMKTMGENHPTEFEIVTAVAFEYYLLHSCDIVVLETGLGGRFDPTNIIDTPELAVITAIGYDHTEILGDTLPKIAFEKAGIIKHNGDVVIYSQSRETERVFEEACDRKGARLHRTDFSGIELHEFGPEGQVFSFEGYDRLKIGLMGRHQLYNASVAVKAAEVLSSKDFRLSEDIVRKGLAKARWPGRLEILSREPVFIIDGAHNPDGAAVLRKFIDEYFPGKPVTFIMGVLESKDYLSMMDAVLPGCRRLFTVTPENPKALSAEELAKYAVCYCNDIHISDTIEIAVRTSIETAASDEVICAFGSLYYIGAIRDLFGL